MYSFVKATDFFTILFFLATATVAISFNTSELDVLERARASVVEARTRFGSMATVEATNEVARSYYSLGLSDCEKLYDESEARLSNLVVAHENFTVEDVRTWLSGVLANHHTCLDGLDQSRQGDKPLVHSNITVVLGEALAFYKKTRGRLKKSKNLHIRSCICIYINNRIICISVGGITKYILKSNGYNACCWKEKIYLVTYVLASD